MSASQFAAGHENAGDTADREIIITRLIAAPRELVFAAFTDPKHVDNWWGPTGFRNETTSMDVRAGGDWIYMMRGGSQGDFDNKVHYLEVKSPERLVYLHGDWKDQGVFHVTLTFEAVHGKTWLTMKSLFSSAEQRAMVVEKYHAIEGGNQTIDRLEAYLPTM
jgi:uncharacterized protein YndB with AHSA1/START domain